MPSGQGTLRYRLFLASISLDWLSWDKSRRAVFKTKYSNGFRCTNRARCDTETRRFANFAGTVENRFLENKGATSSMPATGELIRMMNYVDDIAATLRRIVVGISTMTPEERKRLADYMRNSDPSFMKTLESLDKG